MSDADPPRTKVVIVGGGFAGVGCARALAGHDQVQVTLIDRNNFHQFQPLLYQVATAQLARGDVAYPLRALFRDAPNVSVKLAEVTQVDPATRTVTTADGSSYGADVLVLAAGSAANFFSVPGAEEHTLPLYSLDDAERLRERIIEVFEAVDREPGLIDEGALTFVVVGAGATGTEISGALAEMITDTMTPEFPDVAVDAAQVVLVDHGQAVLGPFSEGAHEYAAKALDEAGVTLRLGTGVTEVGPGHVGLSDGATIRTRCVIWGGGIEAAPVAAHSGLPQGRGSRLEVEPDLTIAAFPGIYALGDFANIPDPAGASLPQLGSVALQSGRWAAKNILADIAGRPRTPFDYKDKGIMAMIGRNAAVAEVGKRHHELHGTLAFAAWLGVHATLMTGVRNRVDAFIDWGSDYFGHRGHQTLDRSEAARIDWGDDTNPGDDHA